MAPPFNVLLVSDRDQVLVQPASVTSIEGDVEQAWLPVRCEGCDEIVLVRGHQTGVADVDMTETTHKATCGECGLEIRGRVEYLQDQYRTWQPLANDNITNGQPVYLPDLQDRVEAVGSAADDE